jgi:integrase
MKTSLLSDLVDEFEETLRSNAYSKATVTNYIRASRELLTYVGNIQARNVTPRHIDGFFATRQAKGLAPSSLNCERAGLRALFAYAEQRRYVPSGSSPVVHRRPFKVARRERLRVPAAEFPRLLGAAGHPRDRIMVALGLFLFLRQSEMRHLRVGDVNLDVGEVFVTVIKTKQTDRMPISAELDAELRSWLAFYSLNAGRPLRPDDYLVPAKTPPLFTKGLTPTQNAEAAKRNAQLNPTRPVGQAERTVQRVLANAGYDLRQSNGKSESEGMHTLRRSGARALFDQLVETGYDGAMRTVQSMLHHASVTTTEIYLGIHLDKKRRDDILRGKPMFPVARENVVSLEGMRGEAEDNRRVV